jgi:hypothetical protein
MANAAERRGELGLDVAVEGRPVDGAVDDPRSIDAVVAQGGDEGLGAPASERCVVDEAVADRRPAGGLDHVGLQRRLVDEDQAIQGLAHERLAPGDPDPASVGDVRSPLFCGQKDFFCG